LALALALKFFYVLGLGLGLGSWVLGLGLGLGLTVLDNKTDIYSAIFVPKKYWNRTTIVEIIVGGWVVSFVETQCILPIKIIHLHI